MAVQTIKNPPDAIDEREWVPGSYAYGAIVYHGDRWYMSLVNDNDEEPGGNSPWFPTEAGRITATKFTSFEVCNWILHGPDWNVLCPQLMQPVGQIDAPLVVIASLYGEIYGCNYLTRLELPTADYIYLYNVQYCSIWACRNLRHLRVGGLFQAGYASSVCAWMFDQNALDEESLLHLLYEFHEAMPNIGAGAQLCITLQASGATLPASTVSITGELDPDITGLTWTQYQSGICTGYPYWMAPGWALWFDNVADCWVISDTYQDYGASGYWTLSGYNPNGDYTPDGVLATGTASVSGIPDCWGWITELTDSGRAIYYDLPS